MVDPSSVALQGLIKEVGSNMLGIGEEVKRLLVGFKNVVKHMANMESQSSGLRIPSDSELDCAERHPISSEILFTVNIMKWSFLKQQNDFIKLIKSLNESEIFYQNELAKYRILTKEHKKRCHKLTSDINEVNRKLNKKSGTDGSIKALLVGKNHEFSSLLKTHLKEILNIEAAIYTRFATCMIDFDTGLVNRYKEVVAAHEERLKRLSNCLNGYISDSFFASVTQNPIEYFNKNSKRAEKTRSKLQPATSQSNITTEREEVIAWTKLSDFDEGVMNLLPGDIIEPLSDVRGGWQYGYSRRLLTHGWYPVSHVKPYTELKKLFLEIKDRLISS